MRRDASANVERGPRADAEPRTSFYPSAADCLTIAHGLCGYVAIALLVGQWQAHRGGAGVTIGDLRLVGTLIAAGAVFDVLDGPVARRFGSSGMGDRLDGMCDTITFGVAPAVVIAVSGSSVGGLGYTSLIAAGGVYLAAMVLRLVRSELTASEVLERGFRGLPAPPASAAAIGVVALGAPPSITCLIVGLVALLIVGGFHYPRQRPARMWIMAGGPAIGLLGVWGALPLKPAIIVMMISTIVLPVAAAGAAWRRRQASLRPT